MAVVKASDLVADFKLMADEKWKYVAGAHTYGSVDCSGAFYYSYKKHGSYMYHGSNTMWRKYTVKKAKIGSIDLVPGMAVFKCRAWNSSNANNGWYGDEPGDMYHVGLYIGDGKVVEAKGKKYGVVISKLSTWHYAATLVDTDYDLLEGDSVPNVTAEEVFPFFGVVYLDNDNSYLNLRSGPDANCARVGKALNGDVLCVNSRSGDWYSVIKGDVQAYAHRSYIQKNERAVKPMYVFTIRVSAPNKEELERILTDYVYEVTESWDAA